MRSRNALRTSFLLLLSLTAAPDTASCQAKGEELVWARADSTVTVEGRRLALRVQAWRDFMPRVGGAQPGSDLMVSLQVVTLESSPLPPGLVVDSAWVRSPQGLWRTSPSREERPELENGLDLMLRGGPRWSTDQTIDVLVRLRLATGAVSYLLARGQPIGRTM